MRQPRSERLKKLESDLKDLQEWLKLGLVPKRDLQNHNEEIALLETKIDDEKARLKLLKETGEDDLPTTRRAPTRGSYTDMPTLPDVDDDGGSRGSYTKENQFTEEAEEARGEPTKTAGDDEETISPFEDSEAGSDKDSFFGNRWERLAKDPYSDPEADEW